MGQARINKLKREREAAERAANVPKQDIKPNGHDAPAKKILIDVSQVPLLKRQAPRFKSLFAMMERKLADPRQVEAICIHETMHFYYLAKSGIDDFVFNGPTITYDETKGFDHTGASVQAKSFNASPTGQTKKSINWAFTVGKAVLGGGIAVEILCPEMSDKGDSGDQERFDKTYDILAQAGLTIPKDEFKKEAERLVRAELNTIPGLKEKIREIANGFMKEKLFTWV